MRLETVTDQNFCEDDYLIANPDIRAAIERRQIASARQHFQIHGYKEGRRQRAPLAFFVHVPKTAGSTINSHLSELVPNGLAHCEGWFFDDAKMQLLDTLTWASGHIAYSVASARIPQFTSRRVEYFCCVRDPTDRVRSHYNWLIEISRREDYAGHPDWVKEMSENIRTSGFDIAAVQANLLQYHWHFLNCQALYLAVDEASPASVTSTFKFIATSERLTDLLFAMTGETIGLTRRENESFRHFDPGLFHRPEMKAFLHRHNARDEELFELVRSAAARHTATYALPLWKAKARALMVRAKRRLRSRERL